MKIIGIDPGYDRMGIAIIEKGAGKEALLHSECFQTSASLPFYERLALVGDHLVATIQKYTPEHLALESVYFNNNQKTAMDVAAVRGVVLYSATSHGLTPFEYTPPQIKAAVGGSGRATKKEVEDMLRHLISIPTEVRLDDEYDAIAVALTHSACVR